MLVNASIFSAAMQHLKLGMTELANAIEQLADFYGHQINWQLIRKDQLTPEFLTLCESRLGLIFQAIPLGVNLEQGMHPLLLQLSRDKFEVYIPGQAQNANLHLAIAVWQCLPIIQKLPTSLKELVVFTWSKFKRKFIGYLLIQFLLSALLLFITILTGYLLRHTSDLTSQVTAVLYVASLMLIAGVIGSSYLNELNLLALKAKIRIYLVPSGWYLFLKMNFNAIKQASSAEWTQLFTSYEAAIESVLGNQFKLISAGIANACLILYLLYTQVILGTLYLLLFLIYVIFKTVLHAKNVNLIGKYLSQYPASSLFLNESLGQINKIRSSNSEKRIHNIWLYKLLNAKRYLEGSVKIEIIIELLDVILPLMSVIILCLYMYSDHAFKSNIAINYILITTQLLFYTSRISTSIIGMLQHVPILKKMSALNLVLTTPQVPLLLSHEHKRFHLKVSHISLRKNDKLILDNISFELHQSEFIGIIGHSGAGKSTLLRVLLGLEDGYVGSVQINGVDIKQNEQFYQHKMGIVLQTSRLFPGSIFSNVAANSGITLEEAWELARQVGLHEDIQAMPMKMYTHISDNPGESLSGGQRQKILIARALANRPQVLLLDEPSSALDNTSQALIFDYLKQLKIAMIVIAHREATLTGADRLYTMSDGKLRGEKAEV